MSAELDAVVIGSGPNGLAAAITVARAGGSVLVIEGADRIGGGLRSEELTGPGLIHDVCSTIHSLGVGSPFMRDLPLEAHGLEWVQPDVLLAHPVSPESAGLLMRGLDATADALGEDGDSYRTLVGPVVKRWDRLEASVLGPIPRWPDHPIDLVRFGMAALAPATLTVRRFNTAEGAGLFMGTAAHAFQPLTRPLTTSFGLLLLALGHRYGWPFAQGGSQSLAQAMKSYLESLGGKVETGKYVTDLADLPPARVILADIHPHALAKLLEGRVPERKLAQYRRFRPGPAAFKVDYALSEPVPWTNPQLKQAGTIHLGGTADAIVAAEASTWAGRPAARPFTLVCQPTTFDPTRSRDGRHALWAYAHVPNGSTSDHLAGIERLILEQAPDFGDVVLDRVTHTPADLERRNPNLVGGDIAGGAHTLRQLVFRPVPRLDPYATPLDRVFLCSSSTPPGGGAHGMAGHLAARSALGRWADAGD